ncbi:hypothetical protein [Paenibacillus sp. MSJ-34]|uniref:hypothetical protein n=1 Tax=Paenibacillus sp. MSJ-34 TaxID=2841529 RepID=UPI001C11ACFC|nr:hypothetical protein [Paenibacillus sp. MSJ-34]MBU5445325.1 hypothetical protein [Paenibacillus sp. MSJ-34]
MEEPSGLFVMERIGKAESGGVFPMPTVPLSRARAFDDGIGAGAVETASCGGAGREAGGQAGGRAN